jgi:hypothetical protein
LLDTKSIIVDDVKVSAITSDFKVLGKHAPTRFVGLGRPLTTSESPSTRR